MQKHRHSHRNSISILWLGIAVAMILGGPLELQATTDDVEIDRNFYQGRLALGYRAVSTDGEPGRAEEYSLHRSSVTGELDIDLWREKHSLSLTGDYENESDYHAALELNHGGVARFWFSTDSLYHNLDHLPFGEPVRPDAYKPPGFAADRWVRFEDRNPGDDYFVEVQQDRASFRGKLQDYPAHLNLTYWRLQRSGRKQLRYADHGSSLTESCKECHVRSQSRTVDRVTEEVKGSVDAHLGKVDLIFEQLYREFRDREPIPVDSFGETHRIGGDWQHDEAPDSRLVASTIKAHSSLSGGLTGAASLTIGTRENRSDLNDVIGVESETDFRKGAADLTWIRGPQWTISLRYRLLDLDNSNSHQVTSLSIDPDSPVEVRDNVDQTRASYAGRIVYRPSRKWTLKGEYERKDIHRGNTGAATTGHDTVWELPQNEEIDRVKIALLGRPLGSRKLRLQTWYEFRHSDDPAYGASAEEAHQVFVGGMWNPTARFGLNLGLKARKEVNQNKTFSQVSSNYPNPSTLHFFQEDRRHEQTDGVVGLWWVPADALSVNFNYGYLRTRTVQDQIFSSNVSRGYFVQDDDLENSQRVHTASLGFGWRLSETLNARFEGRYIDSYTCWDPKFSVEAPAGTPVDSDDLKEVNRLDIRQTGVSLGMDWSPMEAWTCSVGYRYDDYEDRDSDVFDGSVQSYMASVARSW